MITFGWFIVGVIIWVILVGWSELISDIFKQLREKKRVDEEIQAQYRDLSGLTPQNIFVMHCLLDAKLYGCSLKLGKGSVPVDPITRVVWMLNFRRMKNDNQK